MKKYKGFEFVNLGLPSGTMWATCNVGATSETDPGLYFQWGDTIGHPKDSGYDYNNQEGWSSKYKEFYKNYRMDVDINSDLPLENDAVHAAMGGSWRMPIRDQVNELIQNCTILWVENYKETNTKGFVAISKINGNSISFPLGGYFFDKEFFDGVAKIWTREHFACKQIYGLAFWDSVAYGSKNYGPSTSPHLNYGLNARGVFCFKKHFPHKVINRNTKLYSNVQAIDLGLPSGIKWANMNVGATSETDPGLYFQWGDTVGHTKDSGYSFSKRNYVKKGLHTVLVELNSEYDAACQNLGGDWRMPGELEVQELWTNCTREYIENYKGSGVSGGLLTSKINGNTIFFPGGGCLEKKRLYREENFYGWAENGYGIRGERSSFFRSHLTESTDHINYGFGSRNELCYYDIPWYSYFNDCRHIGMNIRGILKPKNLL